MISYHEEEYILLYVDDVILEGTNRESLRGVAHEITRGMEARMDGTVDTFLGIICERDTSDVVLHKATAVTGVFNQFNMEASCTESTPLPPETVL